jgi:AbrB family looped-hinge helix DNA binding protein
MAKVTRKLQVTLPKAVADEYGIRPGSEIEFVAAGDVIRLVTASTAPPVWNGASIFDEATRRQRRREAAGGRLRRPKARGWSREDLYRRGLSR